MILIYPIINIIIRIEFTVHIYIHICICIYNWIRIRMTVDGRVRPKIFYFYPICILFFIFINKWFLIKDIIMIIIIITTTATTATITIMRNQTVITIIIVIIDSSIGSRVFIIFCIMRLIQNQSLQRSNLPNGSRDKW